MKITKKTIMIGFTSLLLTACGSSSSSTPLKDNNTTDVNITIITHNGTDYNTVISPLTRKVWLDRNLGAARVCETFDDEACFGDYYQWGRNFDGHQDSRSAVSNDQVTGLEIRESDFIIENEDWVFVDDTGTKRSTNWSKSDGSSVCPLGFRVPTVNEFEAELLDTSLNFTNRNDVFNSFLKIPSAGFRKFTSGDLVDKGSSGRIWTSTSDGTQAKNVFFDSNNIIVLSELRAKGFSVRCIKN